MLVKVDWISFTVKFPAGEGRGVLETCDLAMTAIWELAPDLPTRLTGEAAYLPSKGRAPYSHSFSWHNNGVTLFVHPKLDHALIEISGKGCDEILRDDWQWDILQPIADRLTRIDIACDILCDTRPLEFVEQRDTGRFKSHSETVSDSGETCYVGSRSSNRYARVYRYNAPHERAPFLRSEFVIKAEDAKLIARNIINDGLHPVAQALGEKFGWLHPIWQVGAIAPSELEAYRPERREGKTLYWLNDTVAPLMLRLHREGVLDIAAWFRENITDKMTAEELALSGIIPF